MIDAQHHVELNGVLYRIAEDAQGESYSLEGTSLRAPNTQQVLGGERAKFQMRPDILLWTQTDWSGGEGQNLFDPTTPNRAWRLDAVDPFTYPGRVFLGPKFDTAKQSDGSTPMAVNLAFTKARGLLWGIDTTTSDDAYEWDDANQKFKAAVNNTVASATKASVGGAAGNEAFLFYIEAATNKVYSYNVSAWALHNDQTTATGTSPMIIFGDYLYIFDTVNDEIFEISATSANTTTAETSILNLGEVGTATPNNGLGQLFAGDERVYFMQVLGDSTVIWEITPTTAAGTGFGKQVVRYDGLYGETSWYHMGTIYTVGTDNGSEAGTLKRVVMYWQPGGQYGTLGPVRQERGTAGATGPATGGDANTLLTGAFALPSSDAVITNTSSKTAIWQVNAVTGGFAVLGSLAGAWGASAAEYIPEDMIEWRGQYFLSMNDAGTNQDIFHTERTTYNINSSASIESPSWDFDLAETKTLLSIQLACEALESNASFQVYYSLDEGSYTSAGTYSTTGGVGTTFVISTDTAEKTFHRLRVRVDLISSNSSNTPVLTAINVRAKAQQKGRKWRLLLDLSDDQSGSRASYAGATKITNLKTAGDAGTVVDFKDGYQDRRAGQYEQVDVTIDDYRIVLDRAGEGVALVELAEVV